MIVFNDTFQRRGWMLSMLKLCTILLLALTVSGCARFQQAPARIAVADLASWNHHRFGPATDYSVVQRQGRPVLRAYSHLSASALYRPVDIDLTETPYLNWSWRVERTLGELDEQAEWGDDFPARVFVLLSPAMLRFNPRALCYVWSSNTPSGGSWPSPYSDRVTIIGVENGGAGRWISEKRNVLDDVRRHFGADVRYIEGIAVMSDTDDSKSETTAYNGDIHFSRD